MAKAAIVLLLLLGCSAPETTAAPRLRIALFASDVTPPLGHPLISGTADEILQPLMLKGIVLDDGQLRVVIGAMDWCELRGGAMDLFRNRIALAAHVPVTQVAIQTTHTHSAPMADIRAEQLLQKTEKPPPHLDVEWMARAGGDAAQAVEVAVRNLQPFTHVGVGQGKVENFASTRRVIGADGKIQVRYSSKNTKILRDMPEGTIDPWLKTVTFYNGDEALVRLHYYASHPQSYYGDGKAHPDTPGLARTMLENEERVSQVYFTGCAGDVTAGKYNDGTPESRQALAKQLYFGIVQAVAATTKTAVSEFSWKTVDLRVVPRTEPEFAPEIFKTTMADPTLPPAKRVSAALNLAWAERVRQRPTIDIGRLRIGPVDILHLPGEPFVEYQLYAQALRPGRFVAVAGYGECGPGYVCTDDAFTEGGYEPTASLVGPPTEALLKAAIMELLR